MDSSYLKTNILPALSEALTAMAVQIPDDQVEFLGKYLLAYVDRKQRAEMEKKNLVELENNLSLKVKEDLEQMRIEQEKSAPVVTMMQRYDQFLSSITSMPSRAVALDHVVNFLETTMHIAYAYAAVREPMGESEVLKYTVAGRNSHHVLGKKLAKPSGEEGEDAPERQGISFEAFKLPEVPEEEEAAEEEAPPEGEEGEEAPPKKEKVPPKPSPLVVPNAMREKKLKFFGLPKLGAYAACPFIYPSLDHDAAVVFTAAEGETPASFSLAKKDVAFLIAMDTVGKFRQFQRAEVERTMALGAKVVELAAKLEASAGEAVLAYLQGDELPALAAALAELAAKVPEEEAAAIAQAAGAPPAEGAEPPAPVEGAELIKAKDDAVAVLKVWSAKFGSGPISEGLAGVQKFSLPLPAAALRLLFAVGSLVNLPPDAMVDVCEDPSWEVLRRDALPSLALMMATYNPSEAVELRGKGNSLAAVKAYCEANAVLDAGSLPVYLPVFASAVLPWLQKALAAREAALVWSLEVCKAGLEA